jgi:hypothetical protein
VYVNASTCTSDDFNAVSPVIWKLCVFLCLVKLSNRFLEQRINIKLGVKLGELSLEMEYGAFI